MKNDCRDVINSAIAKYISDALVKCELYAFAKSINSCQSAWADPEGVGGTGGQDPILPSNFGKNVVIEGMDRCTGHHNITEILLKATLNTIQTINLTF